MISELYATAIKLGNTAFFHRSLYIASELFWSNFILRYPDCFNRWEEAAPDDEFAPHLWANLCDAVFRAGEDVTVWTDRQACRIFQELPDQIADAVRNRLQAEFDWEDGYFDDFMARLMAVGEADQLPLPYRLYSRHFKLVIFDFTRYYNLENPQGRMQEAFVLTASNVCRTKFYLPTPVFSNYCFTSFLAPAKVPEAPNLIILERILEGNFMRLFQSTALYGALLLVAGANSLGALSINGTDFSLLQNQQLSAGSIYSSEIYRSYLTPAGDSMMINPAYGTMLNFIKRTTTTSPPCEAFAYNAYFLSGDGVNFAVGEGYSAVSQNTVYSLTC